MVMMKSEEIERAAAIIREGGLVAFPTETVYGLGANALDPLAVARIFAAKERPSFDPLIVHIASIDELELLTSGPTDLARRLAGKFWPGPLTLVLPKSERVPDIVTSGLETVAVRMPDHPLALALISSAGCPVAAPSANKFGHLSPVTAAHVRKQLPEVDQVLDGGKTTVGIESTIVSLEGNHCTLLRPGKITLQDIEDSFPGLFVLQEGTSEKVVAPGLLKSHYSPTKPLYLFDPQQELPPSSGVILHGIPKQPPACQRLIYTSSDHNYLEVAAHLFDALHAMEDDPAISRIYIEPVEEQGVGRAIMDRIRKAAYKYNKER